MFVRRWGSQCSHHCHATYGEYFGLGRPLQRYSKEVCIGHPLKDARKFVMSCDRCQGMENISKRHEIPQSGILEVELFDVSGTELMGTPSFPQQPLYPCYGWLCLQVHRSHCHPYQWNQDGHQVPKKNIFIRFCTLRALLSYSGTLFATSHLSVSWRGIVVFIKLLLLSPNKWSNRVI